MMRSEDEMFELILSVARSDERIRAAWLNGSRANPSVDKDELRDYDVVFAVQETAPFIADRSWLLPLGDTLIVQEPDSNDMAWGENMDFSRSYTWLMLFYDGNRIDLHIVAVEYAEAEYCADSLRLPLLDKDGLLSPAPPPSDRDYWVKPPTKEQYMGCCNEFFWCQNNIAKGIARKQLPYAMWMYNCIVHEQLIKMLSWFAAMDSGFTISVGMGGKYFEKLLPKGMYSMLAKTYPSGNHASLWGALGAANALFSLSARAVASSLGFDYPAGYEEGMRRYLEMIKAWGK